MTEPIPCYFCKVALVFPTLTNPAPVCEQCKAELEELNVTVKDGELYDLDIPRSHRP